MRRTGWWLVAAYTVLSGVRIGLSVRNWRRVEQVSTRSTAEAGSTEQVTVLQPILAGDPELPRLLGDNVAGHPDARFLWLVDADDTAGRAICERLAAAHADRIEVLLCPPCPPRTNPKVFKLALGLPHCPQFVAVLDDDTVLPPGALARARTALADVDLATGLPWYRPGAGPWSALVAGFVNGNALISYFPLLGFGPPASINGMFYLTSRTALARAGGFEAIMDRVCDDFELAREFRRHGLRIAQTTITHQVSTEVPDAAAYARLMHRWMVFASRLLSRSLTAPMAVLVVLPSALPAVAVGVAVATGSFGAAAGVFAAVAAKVLASQAVRSRLTPEVPRRFAAEYLADWLLPVQSALALLLSRRINWRGRRLLIVRGRLA